MKILTFILGTLLLGQSVLADRPIADFSAKSIVFLVKTREIGFKKDNIIKESIHPSFVNMKRVFPNSEMQFLVVDVPLCMKAVALFAHRTLANYDLLVRIDLSNEPTAQQLQTLAKMKIYLQSFSQNVVVFKATNHQFHKESAHSSDVAMAFINPWHPGLTMEQSQDYWVNHHGPLVKKIGLPSVVTSYTQIHTDIKADQIFDLTYQGLSFETITSPSEFVSYFVLNADVRKLNKALLEDEKNFTSPPLFMVFKKLPL